MSRNIVPRTNKGADLGTPAKNWNMLHADAVILRGNNLQTILDSKTDKSILTDKGDLYVATDNGTITRLPRGIDGYILTTNSLKSEGLEWRPGDVRQLLTQNIEVTVGSGGDFNTINQALVYITSTYVPVYVSYTPNIYFCNAIIRLLPGFIMSEQVLVKSLDLSWIRILGSDAETIINRSALTRSFATSTSYPAFGAGYGGRLPFIEQLFTMDTSGVGAGRSGIYLHVGSEAFVAPGKGVKNAGDTGIVVMRGSKALISETIFSGAGNNGILLFSSTAEAVSINVSGAASNGILATQASTINATLANVSGAGNYGISAEHGSIVNACDANASSTGNFGFYVYGGSIINAIGASGSLRQTANQLLYTGIIFNSI